MRCDSCEEASIGELERMGSSMSSPGGAFGGSRVFSKNADCCISGTFSDILARSFRDMNC